MYSIQYVLALCAAMGLVQAMPSPSPFIETVSLSNGESTISAEIVTRNDVGPRAIFARATDCKGSSLCNNRQDFKTQCLNAKGRIEDTTYSSGGGKSGVCYGNCGIFVQGNGCSYSGQQLREAYDQLRSSGCQACGSVNDNGCLRTINYVTGC